MQCKSPLQAKHDTVELVDSFCPQKADSSLRGLVTGEQMFLYHCKKAFQDVQISHVNKAKQAVDLLKERKKSTLLKLWEWAGQKEGNCPKGFYSNEGRKYSSFRGGVVGDLEVDSR